MKRLSLRAAILSFGITWALAMLFIGWVAMLGWGIRVVEVLSSLYIGFAPTFIGGIIGAVWGFFDGAIGAAIFTFIYNAIVKE
ncbi:hypothetical protein AMJ44_05460 [candidate division WOR-1 bacterium DG_54_3]|uniref:Membrane-associated protein n=1 Tax=candidate division WOR-1 bacterium DG_54_3 TaxID=1703775 RepID=A0A0S7Y300_UNCSA|nr:MAG: hypothetical protein AMJ44_05460 [candidate division WOR-1 bacterium DG_54_3]